MKNIIKNRLFIGLAVGTLTILLLHPVLTLSYFLIDVFIAVPGFQYGITMFTFFCGGLVTSAIIKRKQVRYAVLVALITSGVFFFLDIQAMFSPLPVVPHMPKNIVIDTRKQDLIYDVYILPLAIIFSALGGFLSKKLFGKNTISNTTV